jgi:hypothetical protein
MNFVTCGDWLAEGVWDWKNRQEILATDYTDFTESKKKKKTIEDTGE